MGYKDFLNSTSSETMAQDFTAPINGNGYLPEGEHVGVMIQSVELKENKNGKPYLLIVWANEAGDIKKDILYILKADGTPFNKMFHGFISSLTTLDPVSKAEISKMLILDPEKNLPTLWGMKANIKIEREKRGYIIKQDPDRKDYLVVDAGDNHVILPPNGVEYKNFKDASDAVEMYNNDPVNSTLLSKAGTKVVQYRSWDGKEVHDPIFKALLTPAPVAQPVAPKPSAPPRRSI